MEGARRLATLRPSRWARHGYLHNRGRRGCRAMAWPMSGGGVAALQRCMAPCLARLPMAMAWSAAEAAAPACALRIAMANPALVHGRAGLLCATTDP